MKENGVTILVSAWLFISMFKFIFISRNTLVCSGELALEKSHCTLAFKVRLHVRPHIIF